MRKPLRSRHRGATIAEVVICTMLVGVLVVASMRTVTATRLTQRLASVQTAGPGLAQELLSEVLAQAYADPLTPDAPIGPDAAEIARRFFDDVDDYHNYSGDLETRNGDSPAGFAGWTCGVEVEWVWSNLRSSNQDRGLKRATVTVTSPDGESTTLSGLRWRGGVLEQDPALDLEAVVWVGATLRAGAAGRAARTGVHLPNLIANPNAGGP